MKKVYKLKKGLTLHLKGEAQHVTTDAAFPQEVAVMPEDYVGITPRLLVKEGTHVMAGDTLFVDKASERICVVSPASGTIKEIVRGDRRKLKRIVISTDPTCESKDFGQLDAKTARPDDVRELLLQSGFFALLRQRPYDVVPAADSKPRALFISAFSTMPLAQDFTFAAKGQEADFQLAVSALAKIAPVFVGISPVQEGTPLSRLENAEVNVFDGPNPAGNVGVQINHVAPVSKGETVWTLGAEETLMLGRLLRTGKADFTRCLAVGGSEVERPQYVNAKIGIPLSDILAATGTKPASGSRRIIDGNPLVGKKSSLQGYLGAHTTEVCVLPEGDDVHEAFGWILPRLNQHSTSRTYLSWLMPGKQFAPDCRIKGGRRHMIMSGEYDKVFPMDIYAGYLVKAIISGDIDRQEALGIYEVAPEDFAVAEYVDSSKLELQRIVREGLDLLRKENA